MFGKSSAWSCVLGLAAATSAAQVSIQVQDKAPRNVATLDPTPVGLSFEFFMWPSYMTNITPPMQCIDQFNKIYGSKIPIRIGGTTQDRATYDPNMKDAYVSYTTPDPLVAPTALTYGPKFFDLIAKFGSETMLGFNRANNNRANTYQAVLAAKAHVLKYLWSIELGNEPDLYLAFWNYPVATAQPPWNYTQEGADAASWAQGFIDIWKSPLPILAAGSYAIPFEYQPNWPNMKHLLTTAYNNTVKAATKMYSGHEYTFSDSTNLTADMNHAKTVTDLNLFTEQIALAKSVGREYIMGETGFHGVDTTMDATFGGAIQVFDKAMKAVSMDIKRLFYHQGTINQAFFNWWSDDQVNAPMYGGYMAMLALAQGDSITANDAGNSSYASYTVYKKGKADRVVLINSDYYSGNGTRSETVFTLNNLKGNDNLKVIRFASASSEVTLVRRVAGPQITIAGQYFSNSNCKLQGKNENERVKISQGEAKFTLKASEAVLVYLS